MPLHFFHPQCLELHSKTYLLNFTASLWQCSRSDIVPLPHMLGCFMVPLGQHHLQAGLSWAELSQAGPPAERADKTGCLRVR